MPVLEYVKSSAQNLRRAALQLRQEISTENSNYERSSSDEDRHIHLANQQIVELQAEQQAANNDDQPRMQSISVRLTQLNSEIDSRKKEWNDMQVQHGQLVQDKEEAAKQIEQMANDLEALANLPGVR